MAYTIRAFGHRMIALSHEHATIGSDIRELADTITEVGLLRPLIIDVDGFILDGRKRAAALHLLGEDQGPAIVVGAKVESVVQAATLRSYAKQSGRTDITVTTSRSTIERVEKVIAIAADVTLPLSARMAAAEGIQQMSAGASANGVLNVVTGLLDVRAATDRYPDLSHLPPADAVRMAAYLDALDDDEQRDMELGVIRLTRGDQPDSQAHAMSVYTHMRDLANVVDHERANEVAAALAAAISGHELSPALRDRCLEVADQLEKTAAGIRAAMTLQLEHA